MFGLKKKKERLEQERRERERRERRRCGFSIEQDRIMYVKELESAKRKLEILEHDKVLLEEEMQQILQNESSNNENWLKDNQEKLACIDNEIESAQGAIKFFSEKINNL